MSDDKTLGEIGRSVDRVEAAVLLLTEKMQTALAPIAVHEKELERLAGAHLDLTGKVESVQIRSAFISGGIATLGVVADFILGRR